MGVRLQYTVQSRRGREKQTLISNKAAGFAVFMAFVVGIIGSLALRPPGQPAAPANVSNANEISTALEPTSWRVPVVFQTTLPVLGDNPVYVADLIERASAGAFKLNLFEPGELVPAFSVTDAVRDGKVEAGYVWLGYDQGKIPAAPLVSAVPFGMEPWEYSAWWYEAGGRELTEELYAPHNIHPIFCGMTGPETAGWFRKPIRSLDDVKGLKIRFAGLGGRVIEQLGARVTMLPGGEIFQALEKGAIDATEFALPNVDQTLGFNRVAKYNYYPGWHQTFTSSHMVINLQIWDALPAANRALLEAGCTSGVTRNLASSEASQGAVIAGFVDKGVKAEVLPDNLLRELERVAKQVIEDEAARDASFAKILESQRKFRADYSHWKSRAYLPRDF